LEKNLEHILSNFKPITLAEMDQVQLMNRTDTKFMISYDVLLTILANLPPSYRILEIDGVRQSRYETLYYDNENFHHYIAHQNGKKNRFKFRKRKYVESDLAFFEIKNKTNSGRTIKSRYKIGEIESQLDEQARTFVQTKIGKEEPLEPKLWNNFKRITFVNESVPERLTIDCDIRFFTGDRQVDLPHLVIAELKQENVNRHSPFMAQLKARLIRPDSISKYCLGVALLFKNVKSNTFKEKILKINKIANA
jgi:hypothetical protein